MRKNGRKIRVWLLSVMLAASVAAAGCGRTTAGSASVTTAAASGAGTSGSTAFAETVKTRSDGTDLTTVYKAADLNDTWDEKSSTAIVMSGTSAKITGSGAEYKDGKVVITKAGTYVISGELTDGQIMIDAEKEAVVHVVLNGAKVTSSTSAAFYATKKAAKVIVTLADGTVNELADAKTYTYENADDEEPDAALFVKNDLTLNGGGTLKITASKKAVHTKDNLLVLGGAYEINSADDCFNGKDSISLEGGVYALNVTDTKTGKGMTSHGSVKVYGGTVNVADCKEGIEGLTVEMYDGSVNIVAEDDGLNAREKTEDTTSDTASGTKTGAKTDTASGTKTDTDTKSGTASGSASGAAFAPGKDQNRGGMGGGGMQNNTKCLIKIAGGLLQVDAKGDGLDSNGSLEMSGGEVYISGPTSNGDGSFDWNGTGTITGGTYIAAGSAGMVETFADTSKQNNITVYFDSEIAADTAIKVTDSAGKEICSWTPGKKYSCVQISSPDLKQGETYTVTAGSSTQTVAVSSVNSSAGTRTGGSGNMGRQGGMGPGGSGNGQGKDGMGGRGQKGMKPGSTSESSSASADSGTAASDGSDQAGPPQGGPGNGMGPGGPDGGQAPDGNGQMPGGNGGPGGDGGQPPMGNPPDGAPAETTAASAT